MQGAKNIILGIIFMAVGGGLLMAVDLGRTLNYGFWGLIAVGAVMVAGSLFKYLGPGSAGVDAEQAYKSSSTARLVMQSTLTTALADGHIDDEEVEAIVDACETVVHEHLDPDSVRRLADLVEEKGDVILEEIRYEGKMLNLDARKAVINACVMVLMADGKTDIRETSAINAIGRQLDFSEAETQAIVAETMPAEED
jgi:tellurite resistance protein